MQLGLMRLVNPWRGLVYVAQVQCQCGHLVARTEDFEIFSVYSVQSGQEFYPGRKFSRSELAQWFAGIPLHPEQRKSLSDEFGDIPAIAPNPQAWKWYAIDGRGEQSLKEQFKPTTGDLQRLAGAALSLQKGQFYPLVEPYELWVCDKESENPIALVMTGTTLDDLLNQTFSPKWIANWQAAPAENEPALRNLEREVNARINSAESPTRFGFACRVFQRNLDNSCVEYLEHPDPDSSHAKSVQHPYGFLPTGLLAEPYEAERLKWEYVKSI